MRNKGFINGAIILIIFNLIGKIVGAIYRVPLANFLGPEGIGKYQLIFPLYSLLLTVSTSGVPIAISKLVSEFNSQNRFLDSKRLLKSSILYLTIISIICSCIVVFSSKFIAGLQGDKSIYICYYGIAPAILFVGIISAFRGYFQGNLSMVPTAVSSLIEQVAKLIFGLYFSYKLLPLGLNFGVLGALIGISISEALAFIFLLIYYLFCRKKYKYVEQQTCFSYKQLSKKLISIAVPVTLGGLALPIASIIDSLLVVNILKFTGYSSSEATSLLGLESGLVEPIMNVPVVVAVSISASLLPEISKFATQNQNDKIKNLIEKAFQLTLSIVISCAICFFIFGRQIIEFLYRSIDEQELLISTKLLFINGINLVFVSLAQVSAGILQGIGKHKDTVKSILVGSIIKIVLTAVFVSMKDINIFGAAISGGISYVVVFAFNYSKIKQVSEAKISNVYLNISLQQTFVCFFAFFANILLNLTFGSSIALLAGGFISVLVFLITYYLFFMLKDKPEISTT